MLSINNYRLCCRFLLLCLCFSNGESHRILAVMPFSSTSHKNSLVPLISGLANRGHQLVFITGSRTEQLQKNPNVREIVVDLKVGFTTNMKQEDVKNSFFEGIIENPLKTRWNFLLSFSGVPQITMNTTFSDPQVQDLLANDNFDLVLISMVCPACGYPFAWHFQSPFISISPNVVFAGMASVMGDSEHSEYIPLMFSTLTDRMNLLERAYNTLLDYIFIQLPKYVYVYSSYDRVIHRYFPNFPSVLEAERNTSLLFTNTHPSINYPRTSPPGIIEVGALHCRPAKSLPNVKHMNGTKLLENVTIFCITYFLEFRRIYPRFR